MQSNLKLRLFIGWSGSVSQAVAEALFYWIPETLPFVEPWISHEDINAGRWNPQLESELQNCHAAIFCMTLENQESKWMHFEAGAIALRAEKPLLIPYLFDISKENIQLPLAQFQKVEADLLGTTYLIRDLFRLAKEIGILQSTTPDYSINEAYLKLDEVLQHIRAKFGKPLDAPYSLPSGTGFDYRQLIDEHTQEIIITEQNMQTELRAGILAFLLNRFQNNSKLSVLIILTLPDYFKSLASNLKERQDFLRQFSNTIRDLKEFQSSLPKDRQSNFKIYFHPGVSSLTAIFRDPLNRQRGTAVLIPKWATDTEPESRIFCVIERKKNDHLFNRIYGHIGIMNDPVHSKTLDYVEEWIKVEEWITKNSI